MACTSVIDVITLITTHLPTPAGWKAELAWLVKQHTIVSCQVNVVICRTYSDTFIRGNVVAPFVPTSVAIVILVLSFIGERAV